MSANNNDIDLAALTEDLEVAEVTIANNTVTIEVRENVREYDSWNNEEHEITHTHTWTCDVTRDGDITTPAASPIEVRELVEELEVSFDEEEEDGGEENARVIEVSENEAREAVANDETYEVDGITVYASQLLDDDGELRDSVKMCDGRIVQISEVPSVDAESGSAETVVMTDGGEEPEFESVTADDYPEEPPETVELTVEKDGYTVDIEHHGNRIRVTSTGKHEFANRVKLKDDDEYGKILETCDTVPIDGERQVACIKIPDDVYRRVQSISDEYDEWKESAAEWVENQPLCMRVEKHEYTTGWRTKYHHENPVLKANKMDVYLTHSEERLIDSLIDEYGAADGYPDVSDEDGFSEGDVFTAEELEERVAERVEEKEAEDREAERWSEVCEQYPGVRSVGGATADEVLEAFEQAEQTGERLEIVTETTMCDGSAAECDIDHVTYYATPEGDVERNRTHCH
ncbi:hypothetical protein [Natronococcus occultus]|uniref:Uncharacterized protein n=1 Tax=Natronococcus occultus SP4 TaxID=694430 RepID=L0JYB6_9EURY|nr:hypothetical protein [Natronococcus occultus]AGB38047.1 hypothetical protein Natoc_2269 [Natronococcus occultus SP4]